MQCEPTFEAFYKLLTEKYKQHKKNPPELAKELKNVIKRGKEMLHELQRQNRSERTSLKNVEESEFASKETKFVEKKSVACQVEAAYQSDIRVAHYSDMLTKQDQRNVEDTLSLNRQSRVEQDFRDFTSNERIDTCIVIQNGYKEKTDINARRLTSMMFEVVYDYVLSTKTAMTAALKGISKFAVDEGPYIPQHYFKRTNELRCIEIPLSLAGSDCPRQVIDGLLLAIKESAPKLNTDIFLEDVKDKITGAAQELSRERSCKLIPSRELLGHLDDYLKACIKLTWRMVTQVPPLRLEYQTFTYKRECHKIVESQADVGDDRYQGHGVYYMWPGLKDGGGRTIFKGEVALKSS